MNGKNEIHINQATMKDAIQLWLKDQFKTPPKVTCVRKNTNTHGAGSDQFIVSVEGDQNSSFPKGFLDAE